MEYYLQRLKQGLVIPNSYDEWKDYRNRVTDFILAHRNKKNIVILGAGPSHDIDIGKLSLYYDEIYLVDNRDEAMQEALRIYQLENNEKIKLVISDFWLFPETAMEGLEECLSQKEQITFIGDYLEEIQKWAYENTVYPELGKDADVVAIGIHSQFNGCLASLINHYNENYDEAEIESLFSLLRKWNEVAVCRFHEYVLAEFSSVYLGYEYASYKTKEEYQKLKEVMSLFLEGKGQFAKNLTLERIEGAYEAEKDLSRLVWENKVKISSVQYDFWNFTREKGYLMCLYRLEY